MDTSCLHAVSTACQAAIVIPLHRPLSAQVCCCRNGRHPWVNDAMVDANGKFVGGSTRDRLVVGTMPCDGKTWGLAWKGAKRGINRKCHTKKACISAQ